MCVIRLKLVKMLHDLVEYFYLRPGVHMALAPAVNQLYFAF